MPTSKQIVNGDAKVPPKPDYSSESCAVTITVNRVRDQFPNAFSTTKNKSPAKLYWDHSNGVKQDRMKLVQWKNDTVHVGAENFELVLSIAERPIAYSVIAGRQVATRRRQWDLALKVLWWRIMTTAWKKVRKPSPPSTFRAIKNIVRRAN